MSHHLVRDSCECGARGMWEHGQFWCYDEDQHERWQRAHDETKEDET